MLQRLAIYTSVNIKFKEVAVEFVLKFISRVALDYRKRELTPFSLDNVGEEKFSG